MVLIPTRIPSGNGDNEYYTGYIPAPPPRPPNGNTPNGNGYNRSTPNGNTPAGNGNTPMGSGMKKPSMERRKTDGYGLPITKSPWQGMHMCIYNVQYSRVDDHDCTINDTNRQSSAVQLDVTCV
jgi:hypothetical protein